MKDQKLAIELLSPPGDTIQETMAIKGISLNKLAKVLELDDSEMAALIRGEIAIDSGLASQLASFLNIPESFWIKREAEYRKDLEQTATT